MCLTTICHCQKSVNILSLEYDIFRETHKRRVWYFVLSAILIILIKKYWDNIIVLMIMGYLLKYNFFFYALPQTILFYCRMLNSIIKYFFNKRSDSKSFCNPIAHIIRLWIWIWQNYILCNFDSCEHFFFIIIISSRNNYLQIYVVSIMYIYILNIK